MSVLRDSEIPEPILKVVKELRQKYWIGDEDMYVVDADHENMPEGSYGISAECLTDFVDWMDEVKIEGYWTEKWPSWCLAVHRQVLPKN